MFYNNHQFITKPTNCIVDSYSDHNFMHSFDVMISAPCGDDELQCNDLIGSRHCISDYQDILIVKVTLSIMGCFGTLTKCLVSSSVYISSLQCKKIRPPDNLLLGDP